MKILENYVDNNLLRVNVNKNKALLTYNIISTNLPKVEYKNQEIEFVSSFKHLGVTIIQK
jgi:hypothetical protein